MEPSEVEEWVAEVVEHLHPVVLARARMWHRLGFEAPDPYDLVDRMIAGAQPVSRGPQD